MITAGLSAYTHTVIAPHHLFPSRRARIHRPISMIIASAIVMIRPVSSPGPKIDWTYPGIRNESGILLLQKP